MEEISVFLMVINGFLALQTGLNPFNRGINLFAAALMAASLV